MPRFRFDDPWRILWKTATSDYLLGAVLLALAAGLFLAAWLPQTTVNGLDLDVTWQAEIERRFGSVNWFDTIRPPLRIAGAFHVTDSVPFRLLAALLCLTLLTRLTDEIERVWTARRGDDRPWVELGMTGVYLGSLLILLGAAVTSVWGWDVGSVPLPPGKSVPLGNGSALVFRLVSLAPDGRNGLGEIWRAEDTLVSSGALSVGQPLEGDGVGVYLVGSGAGLRIEAQGDAGRIVELVTGPETTAEEQAVLAFTADAPRHLVGVPEADLVLLVTAPQSEESELRPHVQVFAAGSGEFILEQDISTGTDLTVREVSFSLTPIPYAQIRAVHDRGALWIQIGVIGFIAGASLWLAARARQHRSHPQVAVNDAETLDDGGQPASVTGPDTAEAPAATGDRA